MDIQKLQPADIWHYFYEITQVPRPSKKEEKIIAYLEAFANKHQLAYKKDTAGNTLIKKPAAKGMENAPTVILQSHVDMVCEKNNNVTHDFDNDPIKPIIKDGWIVAEGTTLGADNGIGMAAQLAILDSDKITHGPLECLFTVDEETGLTGAFRLEPNLLTGKILINLDSEDEGEIFIGCAGGVDTIAKLPLTWKKNKKSFKVYNISLTGLKGGHSGTDIDKGFGNSLKLIARFLWNCTRLYDIRLAKLEGGNLRNAIPREANALITVPQEKTKDFLEYFLEFTDIIKKEYGQVEPHIHFENTPVKKTDKVLSRKVQNALLRSIYACPNGVIRMSTVIKDLVETSTNIASVKHIDKDSIEIVSSQRSSLSSSKKDMADQIKSCFELAGAKVKNANGYPGWTPNQNSKTLKTAKEVYNHLFKKQPKILAIHAGLECGLFLEKYPELDMISIGPTIYFNHSPDERMEIKSVQKFWDLLVGILGKIV